MLKIDEEVLAWVVAALKVSSSDECRHHEEASARIRNRIERITSRMHQICEDKLDGITSEDFFLQK